jgi:hypothetical protein
MPRSVTMPTTATPQAPSSDGKAIDWANVAVETTVMLRLQEAPPLAAAAQDDPRRQA